MSTTKCIICNKTPSNIIKIIDNNKIVECIDCNIAYTENFSYRKPPEKYYIFTQYNQSYKRYYFRFYHIYKKINKFVTNQGELLDIGAGHGLFANVLLKHTKFKISVLEPYTGLKYIKKVKNITLYKSPIETFLKNYHHHYDVITLIDVLEHLYKPDEKINKIKNILNNDGLLIIQMPNYQSLMAKICKHWSWWDVQEHPYHFTHKSIINLLKKSNYVVVNSETYEEFNDFKKNLFGNFTAINNVVIRRILKVIIGIPILSFYIIFRPIIWYFNYGALMIIIAKKNEN